MKNGLLSPISNNCCSPYLARIASSPSCSIMSRRLLFSRWHEMRSTIAMRIAAMDIPRPVPKPVGYFGFSEAKKICAR